MIGDRFVLVRAGKTTYGFTTMTCGDRAFQHLGKVFPDRQQADPSTQMGRSIETMINGALEMPRSLAAVAGRKSTPFHGADGADALQGIGQ
jgi:hypothetical protein